MGYLMIGLRVRGWRGRKGGSVGALFLIVLSSLFSSCVVWGEFWFEVIVCVW